MDNKVGVTEGDCVIYFRSIVFILVGFLFIRVGVNHGGQPCLWLIFKGSFENRESKPVLLKHREKEGREIVSRLNVLIPSQQYIQFALVQNTATYLLFSLLVHAAGSLKISAPF